MKMNNPSTEDEQKLEKLMKLIEKEEGLSEITENEILAYFGLRGEKAVKILKEKRLHKLLLNKDLFFWEVEGKSKNYIIINSTFCECTDFQIRVLGREEKSICYHLLAKIIGERLKLYDSRELSEIEYEKILESRI